RDRDAVGEVPPPVPDDRRNRQRRLLHRARHRHGSRPRFQIVPGLSNPPVGRCTLGSRHAMTDALADIEEIRQLNARYCQLMEQRRWSEWSELSLPDAELAPPVEGMETLVGGPANPGLPRR